MLKVESGIEEPAGSAATPGRADRVRIDAEYAGPCTWSHEGSGPGQDFEGELSITLEEREGVPYRDR